MTQALARNNPSAARLIRALALLHQPPAGLWLWRRKVVHSPRRRRVVLQRHKDCVGRSKGALGSTNPAKSKDGKTANLGGAYFDSDPKVNPQMYNWNHVFLRYCDGAHAYLCNRSLPQLQPN